MKKNINVSILGISIDMGFLGKTKFNPKHGPGLYFLMLRSIPVLLVYYTGDLLCKLIWRADPMVAAEKSRHMARKLFSVFFTNRNMHTHENGMVSLLEKEFQAKANITNLARVGNSLRKAVRKLDEIPNNQDVVFIHLGSMDFFQKSRLRLVRANIRKILSTIGKRSPNAHVVFLGMADFMQVMADEANKSRIIPFFPAPTVEWLHGKEGFHHRLKITADISAEEYSWAERYQNAYKWLFKRELQNHRQNGRINSFSYVDLSQAPMYAKEHRREYFAIDGLHLSEQGSGVLGAFAWETIEADMKQAGFYPTFQYTSEQELEPELVV